LGAADLCMLDGPCPFKLNVLLFVEEGLLLWVSCD
jgi:hypothetical protein